MASERSRGNPRLVSVGRNPYRVVVTENWIEASEWARELQSVITSCGSVIYWMHSIHLAYSSRALVYRPAASEEGIILPDGLLLIFCNPSYFFIGDHIRQAMELLGVQNNLPLAPTIELRRAPGIFGIPLQDLLTTRLPLHVAAAAALLEDMNVSLLRTPTRFRRSRWNWPLNDDQVEEAVQAAAIPEMIGKLIIARDSEW
ncbi:unnamed protein product [Spirodela intermedia]|uniref:Uncharacterized protein n=1 Tax=Spirodela intermedia TaxID=51605 RepID=A0A7I8KR69_SPIIN|nr:unnamed protein product [Spirodela intermedia]